MFLKLNATFPHGGRECFPSSFPIAMSRSPWELFNATIRFLSLGTSKCNHSSLIYSGKRHSSFLPFLPGLSPFSLEARDAP